MDWIAIRDFFLALIAIFALVLFISVFFSEILTAGPACDDVCAKCTANQSVVSNCAKCNECGRGNCSGNDDGTGGVPPWFYGSVGASV
jgi:hypothetical protein